MGTRRYSRDPAQRRWEERFDDLQARCRSFELSPTIGELRRHGIPRGQWQCRSVGWRGDDGRPECFHASAPFLLAKFGDTATVTKLRGIFVCSECGRNRPHLLLLAY